MHRPIIAVALGSALYLGACSKPSEPKSAALDAEVPPQTQSSAFIIDPAPAPPAAGKSLEAGSPVQADSPAVSAEPERLEIPAVDPKRVADLEARVTAQREEIDQLKAGQIETRSLIESLRAETQQTVQSRLLPATASGSGETIVPAAPDPHRHPAKTPPLRRREVRKDVATPPFSVESVDTWGSEKHIVLHTPTGRLDLTAGQAYAGWTALEDSDAAQASFRDPRGRQTRVAVRWK